MMDPRQYQNAVKECWAVHQALRSLGFAAEDIYVSTGKDEMNQFAMISLFVVLKSQDKEFVVTLEGYQSKAEAYAMLNQWDMFVMFSNGGVFDKGVMNVIYESSNVMQNKVQFVVALNGKGFKFQKELAPTIAKMEEIKS